MNSKMRHEELFDFIIIGAGASGLSLLLELCSLDNTHKVKVLERNISPMSDRIWSFWRSVDGQGTDSEVQLIKPIISHQWLHWSLSTSERNYVMRGVNYRYCSVHASALSELSLKCADNNPLVSIQFNCEVESIVPHGAYLLISTGNEKFLAKKVIDTRPPILNSDHQGLLQCFYGEEIVVDANIFDGSCVKLMDQLKSAELGIEFVYILPFSSCHALIEFTCFSLELIGEAILKERLQQVIKEIVKHHKFKVVRTEKAVLPMYSINRNINQYRHNGNLIYAGIAGGNMRAATGYSFLNSQRWAKQCANELINGQTLSTEPPISLLYQYMDAVMLSALRNDMSMGVKVFEQMFKNVNSDSFARFMTERATLFDFIAVIWAMPMRAFIRAAFSVIFTQPNLKNKKTVNKSE